MTRETAREERLRATEKAVAGLAERRAEARRRTAEPPRPGDTFLFRRTAEHPVEWVVVERRPEDGRRLGVPLDDFPFAGSRDVELLAGPAGGTANVRCDLGVWLDAGAFDSELRTGALAAEDLERVRARRRAVLDGRPEASPAEREVDGDPEYRRWRDETLRAACDTLSAAPEEKEARRGEGGLRRWGLPLALAASAVLAVKLSSVHGERQLRDALQAERQRVEEREARIAELRAEAREPQVNLPLFELQGGERVRGDAFPLALPREAKRLALALEVEDPEYYPRYRLRIVARGGAEVIWQTEELVKTGRWLRLDLPASFFEAGREYELRIEGLTDGRGVELAERYLVEVRR